MTPFWKWLLDENDDKNIFGPFRPFGHENKLKRVRITPKMLKTCRNLPKFTFCAMYNILHHAFYAQVHIVYTCFIVFVARWQDKVIKS